MRPPEATTTTNPDAHPRGGGSRRRRHHNTTLVMLVGAACLVLSAWTNLRGAKDAFVRSTDIDDTPPRMTVSTIAQEEPQQYHPATISEPSHTTAAGTAPPGDGHTTIHSNASSGIAEKDNAHETTSDSATATTTATTATNSSTTIEHPPATTTSVAPKNFTCYHENRNMTWTSPFFPHFIIAGAQKAGTTAIADLLRHVPRIVGSKKREVHFWDGRINRKNHYTAVERCHHLYHYAKYFDFSKIKEDSIVFEKTPSLLTYDALPNALRLILAPHTPKLIVILRDPIERMYSHFKMSWQTTGRPASPGVEALVAEEVRFLKKAGLVDAPPFSNDTAQWENSTFAVHPKYRGDASRYSRLHGRKKTGMVLRGLYSVQLRFYLERFALGETLMVVRYERFKDQPGEVLSEILAFVGGPPHGIPEERLASEVRPVKKKGWYPPLTNETRAYLQRVYRPFNDDLANLLGEDWRDVWGY